MDETEYLGEFAIVVLCMALILLFLNLPYMANFYDLLHMSCPVLWPLDITSMYFYVLKLNRYFLYLSPLDIFKASTHKIV